MSLHREDRELQIRLAELQADIQIYLTLSFGLLAMLIAVMVGLQQIYFILPSERVLSKNFISFFIPLIGFVCFFAVIFLIKKMFDTREQMKKLRKKYAW